MADTEQKAENKVIEVKTRIKEVITVVMSIIISLGIIVYVPAGQRIISNLLNSLWQSVTVDVSKPAIYLYPEEKTDIDVIVDPAVHEFSTTYPNYGNDGWHVIAYPDGRIENKADGETYSYLFWESDDGITPFDMSTGFCIRGSETQRFLDETLTNLGLNENEKHDFIVYWLPLMEHNEYNLISFQYENYSENNKLSVTPEPDSVLRVFMAFEGLDKPVSIIPQEIRPFKRKGFTVVEWGGTEISGIKAKIKYGSIR